MHNIMEKIYLKKDIENIDKKLKMLGKTRLDAVGFINLRVFTTILFTLFLIFFTHISYLFLPLLVILYYMGFYHILITRKLKLREQKLDREALYYFEVLTLTLESGKNLQNSLELTCKNVHSELSSEFEDCLNEVKVGKSLNIPSGLYSSLIKLGERTLMRYFSPLIIQFGLAIALFKLNLNCSPKLYIESPFFLYFIYPHKISIFYIFKWISSCYNKFISFF